MLVYCCDLKQLLYVESSGFTSALSSKAAADAQHLIGLTGVHYHQCEQMYIRLRLDSS